MNERKELIFRVKIVFICFIIVILALIARLGYIQVVKADDYSKRAMAQQYKDVLVPPKRGAIYDRSGKELAISILKHDFWMEVTDYTEEEKILYARTISKILEIDEKELLDKMNSKKVRFPAAKFISTEQMKGLKKAGIRNIWFEDSSKRYYPHGKFAAYVIGHVSDGGIGEAGIESSLNFQLKGVPGRKIFVKDAKEQEISISNIKYNEPINGNNVVLTIDEVVQHIAEKASQSALDKNQAKRVTAIVMNPKTGDVLAMASKPDYDPNLSRQMQYDLFQKAYDEAKTQEERNAVLFNMWRNPAVSDSYEPGSPFKLITATAALEEGITYPDEWFRDDGYVVVKDRTIGNWTSKPYGQINFTNSVVHSVNSTFIKVSERLGKTKMLDYVHAYGFGHRTGIELPSEGEGILYSNESMGPVELATTSFGQGVAVTPIQMVNSVCAIANEGRLMKPRIIKEITDQNGGLIQSYEPEMVKRVVSKETAATMLSIMEAVVNTGGNGINKIEGYRVGGKSGTAQKPVPGGYSPYFYVASYVGVVPIEDPQLVVFVAVDEPSAGLHYGTAVAGPVVNQIMIESLRYLGIKPNVKESEDYIQKVLIPEVRNIPVTEAIMHLTEAGLRYSLPSGEEDYGDRMVVDCFPKPGNKVASGSSVVLYLGNNGKKAMIMPDLTGKTLKEVEIISENMGLQLASVGTGKAIEQMPSAGTEIHEGDLINVEFSE